MSVAFRRESDEEHKGPRFELPIPLGPNLVTPRGLALAKAKAAEFEARIAAEKDETRLDEARRDLRYWRTRLATAEPAPQPLGDEVAFGTCVAFRLKGRERIVRIVGDDEADPANNLISFSSPLARAMMGACEGDLMDFGTEEEAIEILSVEPLSEVWSKDE